MDTSLSSSGALEAVAGIPADLSSIISINRLSLLSVITRILPSYISAGAIFSSIILRVK